MSKLTQRAIRVYAVLEAYRPGQGDILDSIIPFFEPFIADGSGKVFDPTEFASALRAGYGWNVTADVIEEMIPRFVKRGWLTEVGTREAKAFRNVYTKKDDNNSTPGEMKITEAINDLAGQFKDFANNLSPLTTYSRTTEELAEVLIEWLISIDSFTPEALQAHTAKITNQGGRLAAEFDSPEGGTISAEDRYLAARFVQYLFKTKSNYTGQLSRIASIGFLTDVVQDFSKPDSVVNKTDLIIYLDAPVALDYLGVSGKAAQENAAGSIEALKAAGATIRIFRLSVDELTRALHAVLARKPNERVGATADALRRREVLELYVKSVKDDPDSFLKTKGVGVDERTIDQFPNSFQYFTHDQHDALYSKINWHFEVNPRVHDATISTLIMRMRQGQSTRDIFRSRYILVTRNAALADRVRAFCISEKCLAPSAVGPAIHQRQLATAAWLRTGLGQTLELPRRYLLAACERVLSVKRNVVEQARAAAKALTPEQASQLELLLTQDRSAQLLMDKTLGISTVITPDNIEMLVGAMKNELVKEKEEEKRGAIEEEKRRSNERRKKDQDAVVAGTAREAELRQKIDQLNQAGAVALNLSVDEANRRNARRKRCISLVMGSLVLLLGALPLLTESLSGNLKFAVLAVGGVASAFLAFFQLWDRPTGIQRWLEKKSVATMKVVLSERGIQGDLSDLGIQYSNGRLMRLKTQPISRDPNMLL